MAHYHVTCVRFETTTATVADTGTGSVALVAALTAACLSRPFSLR